ncbi:hypothetical protein JT05_02015 [Desulfosporosinus sp. Tol-M]|nr:hypothetical protein JT05_02015 [Desulfosporosinus sp. Tol-M]
MKEDKLLIAGVIGALSTIPAEIVTRILLIFGIGKYTIYQLDSLIFTINRPTTILGLIVCLIVGGTSAILLYLAFERLGSDNLVIKSVMFGVLLCIFLQIILKTVEGIFIDIRPISDYYTHLFGAVIFGITEGILFKRFLFNKTTQ